MNVTETSKISLKVLIPIIAMLSPVAIAATVAIYQSSQNTIAIADHEKRIQALATAVTDINATIREGFMSVRQGIGDLTRQVGRLEDRLSTTTADLNKSIVNVNNRLSAVRWLKTDKDEKQ